MYDCDTTRNYTLVPVITCNGFVTITFSRQSKQFIELAFNTGHFAKLNHEQNAKFGLILLLVYRFVAAIHTIYFGRITRTSVVILREHGHVVRYPQRYTQSVSKRFSALSIGLRTCIIVDNNPNSNPFLRVEDCRTFLLNI